MISNRRFICILALLLEGLDANSEICRFHKPVILALPVLISVLQFEFEATDNLWYKLRHFQI